MKNGCKKKMIIIGFLAVFIVFLIAMNLLIQGDFRIRNIYYGVDEEMYDSKESFVSILTDNYNISRSEAEELYESEDFMKINIGYTITNKSLFPMYVSKTVFCNDSRVFVCVEKPESQSKCYVSVGESTTLSTSIILKKSDFTTELLENLKIYALTAGVSPLVKLDFSSSVANLSNLTESSEPDELFPDLFEHKKNYYLPAENKNTHLTLNDLNNSSVNINRFCSEGDKVYCVDRFEYSGVHYCGFAFFDENGKFQRGMAIHKLFDDKTDFNFQVGESTVDDVRAVDGGSLIFEMPDETQKTYHYFNDGTCIEITYSHNVVAHIAEFSVEDMFSCLIKSDSEYIKHMHNE